MKPAIMIKCHSCSDSGCQGVMGAEQTVRVADTGLECVGEASHRKCCLSWDLRDKEALAG